MKKRFKVTDYFIENHEHSTQAIDPERISVLNWNIQKKNFESKWSDEFKTLIVKYNPAILLLQETRFKKGLESILHLKYYGFIFAPNFIDIFNNLHSGVLTASHSKYRCVTVTKSHAVEPFIKVPKIFLSTKYNLLNKKKDLLVLNIHAINFVGLWKFISQIQQLEQSIKSFDGPVILSGDFNTWNKRRTKILDKILTECGLKKVDFHLDDQKHIKKFLFSNHLDHIYYKGLTVQTSEVIKTDNSDHNPLNVVFSI